MIKLRDLLDEKIIGGRAELYPEKEVPHLIAAAWIDPIGDIYTGNDHHEALENAANNGQEDAKVALNKFNTGAIPMFHPYMREQGWRDGFLTSEDNWVSREDAMLLAKQAKQLKANKDKYNRLDSYDLSPT